MANIEKPMNPYAKEDFAHAVREATNNLSDELKRIGEQMKADFPFMDEPYVAFEDFDDKDYGIMHLNYCNGLGAWDDVVHTLIAHGYGVSLQVVGDKVVIEYEEVE